MKKPNRDQESLAFHFTSDEEKADCFLLTASDDKGVRLNLGRAGARYAPLAIINSLKKMAAHKEISFFEKEIFEKSDSLENSQKNQIKNIEIYHQYQRPLVHLGGGHDHVYPLVMSLKDIKEENIFIINIDAHLDTRVDEFHHSGTPFRNIDRDLSKNITLLQYGIHDFANSKSTQSGLKKIKQHILNFEKIKTFSDHFTKLPIELIAPFLKENTKVIISLDADALESSLMSAVSAVNHEGLPLHHVRELVEFIKMNTQAPIFGIYEYNPLYDDLSAKGARALSSLIYTFTH